MRKTRLILFPALMAVLGLGGCGTFAGGNSKPDEFRVVTKAPLVMPPEYKLLPPRPGEVGPEELRASQAARRAILGTAAGSSTRASIGERALVQSAARGEYDPDIRAKLDIETAQLTTKTKSFADRILFWRNGDTYMGDSTPLDADAEAERLRREKLIKGATGGGKVVIRKRGRVRLPGL